jgi:AcrR family transcriptional regulator
MPDARAGTRSKEASQARGGPRRTPDSERSRAEILDAAFSLFASKGFGATTINEIAEKANVAKGLVLFHYKTKEGVFQEVIRRAIPTLLHDVEAIGRDEKRPASDLLRDALRQAYRSLVRRAEARSILRLLIAEGSRTSKLSDYYHSEIVARGNAALIRIVEMGVARGEFDIELNRSVSHVLLGPLISAVIWRIVFEDIEMLDLDELCETHIEMTLQGLVRRP